MSTETKRQISVLIKPASSSCNLRCSYCFYADVSESREVRNHGNMSPETIDCLTARIDEALEHEGTANISFQGGEPTVAGLDYFRSFTQSMARFPNIMVNYSIQTNGTLLDKEWAQFFHDHHFLVGVSLDGYQTNMDRFRYDAKKKGVYYRVLAGIDELKKADVEFNILTVVTSELAAHPKALFEFYRSHKFNYVQLIPCLPGLYESDDMALTPERYSSFYIQFFRVWREAWMRGTHISVNLFDNLAGMLGGELPYQCGMIGKCFVQYVIESNGDVYPCDFYCLDEYCLGNLKDRSFREMSESAQADSFLAGSACTKKPCESCPYLNFCHGGCRRQNVCYLTDESCAYRQALDVILPELYRMIDRQ